MLGNIIGIEEDVIILKLTVDLNGLQSLINKHVYIEDKGRVFVGEISNIKDGTALIKLLGEIIGEKFVYGLIGKPSFGASVEIVPKDKIPMIISVPVYDEKKDVYIGDSSIYPGIKIGFNINDFFANHFAIFGNSGSGKSWGTSRLIQSIFDKQNTVPYNASIFIFDAYGEYHSAFSEINDDSGDINFKAYTTNTHLADAEILKIPLWIMSLDDITLLLGAESPSQIPIIEKALKYVTLFVKEEEEVIKGKNDIIARAILDVLSSGRNSSQIRDQIFSVLTKYNTKDLNLETQIYQPGYVRSLKQCLNIDASGKIRDIELITNFITTFLDNSYELVMPDGTFTYGLKDLENALDFALLSEGALNSNRVFDDNNIIKVRLHTLISGDYAKYFECDQYISLEDYIMELTTAPNGKRAQIINFNINYVDDRFAKILTKIYSRILFEYVKNLDARASMPIHIILEEAHRYVQNDSDVSLIGYNIFDRITKEGRKYGILLGFISQRPSDLSETAVSQCSNFLIFKMMHPKDVSYIRDMVPNITDEIVKRLKILQPGNCVAFGTAFKVPVLIKMDRPVPPPSSNSCDVSGRWFIDKKSSNIDHSSGGIFSDGNYGRMVYKGENPNNYIMFNGELWRIISKEVDGSYKIIKNESIGKMSYDSNADNNWNKPCSLNTYLNNNYYNSFKEEDKSKILNHEFNIGPIGSNNIEGIINDEETIKWHGKIGIINLSDYLKATLNNGNYIKSIISSINNSVWTISAFKNNASAVCNINPNGSASSAPSNNVTYSIIPIIYIKANLSGIGSMEQPFNTA